MKEFLKISKTNKIILFALAAFAVSFVIHWLFRFDFLLYLSGFFLALFVPGMAISNVIDHEKDWLAKLITAPVFTIFFFIPLYYGITLLSHREINLALAFIPTFAISLCSVIITYNKNIEKEDGDRDYRKFVFFGIVAFLIVHAATTLAYRFVPEIDGYSYIMNIKSDLSAGTFGTTYRPLFTILAEYISVVSHIAPYWLFKFGLVIIQISGVYYLCQIMKSAGLKKAWLKYLVLLAFVSVPVINLEIDYVRPNIIFIFGILPFVYYLSSGLDGPRRYLAFSTIIATAGLLFHEFFGIFFLVNLFFIASYFYKKINYFKRVLFSVASGIIFFILLLNIEKIPPLHLIINSIGGFIDLASSGLRWKWWFLNAYSNVDGFNLGWNGFGGILKYYAYSISPFLAFVLLFYLYALLKGIQKEEKFSFYEKISFLVLIMGLIFTEFLPRINFPTLPDRFWPMISISLIILLPFLFSRLSLSSKKMTQAVSLILILIGIGGSIYIARAKGGYTSNKEYKTAQWIQANTPNDSIFLTQGENGVMLEYFAQRKGILVPNPSFFGKHETTSIVRQSKKIAQNVSILFGKYMTEPSSSTLDSLNSNLSAYSEAFEKEKVLDSLDMLGDMPADTDNFVLPQSKNIYVLYSLDKFNNYYANRQWWKDANFYGADLSKFNNDEYALVYNDSNIIYIWKRK